MKVLLAEPRGFCAGVDRAIEIVERALELFGPPVYVRHEIVHNRHVVDRLREKGAVFVDEVEDAPEGAVLIFSAHGVSRDVQSRAEARGMRVIDATCPLVTKVHLELVRHWREGRQVVLIGHRGHPEVEGTMGQVPEGAVLLVESEADVDRLEVHDPGRLAYVTQTTLSVDDTAGIIAALKRRFPDIRGPKREDICYATSNRQAAVKALAAHCDLVLVVGSPNSSNSNRLREVAERAGCPAHLIDGPEDIEPGWFAGVEAVGLTAGASAPEVLVQRVIDRLRELGAEAVETVKTAEEHVHFPLPGPLRDRARAG